MEVERTPDVLQLEVNITSDYVVVFLWFYYIIILQLLRMWQDVIKRVLSILSLDVEETHREQLVEMEVPEAQYV